MPFYVYIILCKGGSFYTGSTKDVEERAKLHANGRGSRYTKMYPPKRVAYVEQFITRSDAMRRERAIKKLSRKQNRDLIKSQTPQQKQEVALMKIQKNRSEQAEKSSEKITKTSAAKKSWIDKLNDSKDLPKIEPINQKMSLKWGTGTLVIPAPIEVDELMRKVPEGKVTTINEIRIAIAKKHGATIGCPMTTGIFSWIAAHAADEREQKGEKEITPYWRTLKTGGLLNEKYPGGTEKQKLRLETEGHIIIDKGKNCVVQNYDKFLAHFE
jgi:predicted GIY-YIG superfamily endonuclease/alkylated DNA nucleotide flippase Atl1